MAVQKETSVDPHASNHTDGIDDIQNATNAQKGLATAAQVTNQETNTTHISSDGSDHSFIDQAVTILSEPAFTALAVTSISTSGIEHSISLIPTGVLETSAVWHGIHIDGVNLDPSGTGAEIVGIEIDLSGVDVTSDPVMHGIEIEVPLRKDAIHIHEGQVVINNTPDSAATTEFHGLDVRVDTASLASTSVWSALAVTAIGGSTGQVDAILARNEVGPLRQEIAAFVTPSQTEFAGRKTGGGATWVDGIDGIEIFIVDNDEIYVGSAAQFSQIEVIMGTGATKDCQPTFHYNTAADTWTEFFPDDETSGFQTSSLISWIPSSISGLWTNNGDPGAGDTTAGFWIKIIRTRNADPGTPTPTTIKVGTVVTHQWNKTGDLTVNSITPTSFAGLPAIIPIDIIEENFNITTGIAIRSFRMPYAMTLTEIRINTVKQAPTGSTIIVDLNETGSTVLSTKVTIDATEFTSVTAATPPVISDSALADDALMTFDVDQIGSTLAGQGLQAVLIGVRT